MGNFRIESHPYSSRESVPRLTSVPATEIEHGERFTAPADLEPGDDAVVCSPSEHRVRSRVTAPAAHSCPRLGYWSLEPKVAGRGSAHGSLEHEASDHEEEAIPEELVGTFRIDHSPHARFEAWDPLWS